ncbi:MAG: hypothetical protein WB783_07275 [Arenicellales bacterium]|jgi:tRNA(Ile2) C34 agmatinyltransferase TiaS
MKLYAAFDDTDVIDAEFGTGKLVRMLKPKLPEGIRMIGVVRHQLLVAEGIPYTSHNSPACAILEVAGAELMEPLIEVAVGHIEALSSPGSDPGLCVALADQVTQALVDFGHGAGIRKVTQADARTAARGIWLSGHGGTNDGIIGAAAAVGLTAHGWEGRFIEYGALRDMPDPISVAALHAAGILPVTLERNVQPPAPEDLIDTQGWLRPRLCGGRAVLPLLQKQPGSWYSIGREAEHG